MLQAALGAALAALLCVQVSGDRPHIDWCFRSQAECEKFRSRNPAGWGPCQSDPKGWCTIPKRSAPAADSQPIVQRCFSSRKDCEAYASRRMQPYDGGRCEYVKREGSKFVYAWCYNNVLTPSQEEQEREMYKKAEEIVQAFLQLLAQGDGQQPKWKF